MNCFPFIILVTLYLYSPQGERIRGLQTGTTVGSAETKLSDGRQDEKGHLRVESDSGPVRKR